MYRATLSISLISVLLFSISCQVQTSDKRELGAESESPLLQEAKMELQGSPGDFWLDVKVGDFDGDGKADVLGRTQNGQWWAGFSDGSSFRNQLLGTWSPVHWQDVGVGDFNGDGKQDIAGRVGGNWWVSLSAGRGSFLNTRPAGIWSAEVTWPNVFFEDFDQDGATDFLGRVGGQFWLTANSADEPGTNRVFTSWAPVDWKHVVTGDFNGDGRPDIAGLVGGDWWVSLNLATGIETRLLARWNGAVTWEEVVVLDANGDGSDDILARTGGNWWLGLATEGLLATQLAGSNEDCFRSHKILTGDMDGDGLEEMFCFKGPNVVAVSFVDPGSPMNFTRRGSIPENVSLVDIAVADVTGDGLSDWIGRDNTTGIWYNGISNGENFATRNFGAWAADPVPQQTTYFPADYPNFHQLGQATSDKGWETFITSDGNKYLTFGTGVRVRNGYNRARFTLAVDNHTARNDNFATIEVYNATTGEIVNSREIFRQEFTGSFVPKDFDVPFNVGSGEHRYEFRVLYKCCTYMKHFKTELTWIRAEFGPLQNATCQITADKTYIELGESLNLSITKLGDVEHDVAYLIDSTTGVATEVTLPWSGEMTPENSRAFSCQIENQVGSNTASVNITVATTAPKCSISASHSIVGVYEPVTVFITQVGNVRANQAYFIGPYGRMLVKLPFSTVFFPFATQTYQCEVSNGLGTTFSGTTVWVD